MLESASHRAQCPICNNLISTAANLRPYQTKRGLKKIKFEGIVYCSSCQSGFAEPAPTEAQLQELYAHDTSFWGETGDLASVRDVLPHFALSQSRIQWIQSRLPRASSVSNVLDIGAGNGAFGLALASKESPIRPQKYFAQDSDPRVLGKIRNLWPSDSEVKIEAFDSLSTIPPSDLVILSHVLEHVAQPESFLEEVKKRLLPGGFVFIEVPHGDERFKTDVFPHVLFFRPKGLESIMERVGFKTLAIEIIGGDYRQFPFTAAAPSTKRFLERLFLRLRFMLPLKVLSRFYHWYFGLAKHDEQGPWIRYLGQLRA